MALIDHVSLFEIAAAQTPIFTVEWRLPRIRPGEQKLSADDTDYMADTYSNNAMGITASQFDILRPCRKLAIDYTWAVLTRTPNRIKTVFRKPIAAMILSDDAIINEAVAWEAADYDSDQRDAKLRNTKSYGALYGAIAALVAQVNQRGGAVRMESG